jgi:phosphohistidine phosphatase
MNYSARTLYLLRHAKSDWDDPALADIDRPLAPRGRKAARAMARYLKNSGIRPELILCSPARRARQTLELLTEAWPVFPNVSFAPWLYAASASKLLAKLRELPHEAASVMLIGHNPGLEDLATTLAGTGVYLNRPGIDGGSLAWRLWSHDKLTPFNKAVPRRDARTGDKTGHGGDRGTGR